MRLDGRRIEKSLCRSISSRKRPCNFSLCVHFSILHSEAILLDGLIKEVRRLRHTLVLNEFIQKQLLLYIKKVQQVSPKRRAACLQNTAVLMDRERTKRLGMFSDVETSF